jgi:hypothetical protein
MKGTGIIMDKLTELFESINSEILTDEVKLQMSTLFEAAINEAVEAKEQELEESNRVEISEFKEELVEQVDEYLNYFVEEYIKENETVVEDYAKVKLAEKVLRNFKQMTEAFNISLSEESISSEDEVEELTAENTKLVNKLIEAKKETELVKKAAFIAEAAEKLDTDIQREKLVEQAKGLEFDEEIYEAKLQVLVDTILVKESKDADEDDEQLEDLEESTVDKKPVIKESDQMAGYLKMMKITKK